MTLSYDPRAEWMTDILRRLCAELDPDAIPLGVSIQVISAGQVVNYGVNVFSGGEVVRLVTDAEGLETLDHAIRDGALSTVITDATVRDGPQ